MSFENAYHSEVAKLVQCSHTCHFCEIYFLMILNLQVNHTIHDLVKI